MLRNSTMNRGFAAGVLFALTLALSGCATARAHAHVPGTWGGNSAPAPPAFDALVPLAHGIVADNIMYLQIQAPSGSASPYTPVPKVVYSATDYANAKAAGITYFRVPIGVEQLLSGIPYPTTYLQTVSVTAASWASTAGGQITFRPAVDMTGGIAPGSTVTISGVKPAGYNGTYTVVSVTATALVVVHAADPGFYVSGGAFDVWRPLPSNVTRTVGNPSGCVPTYFSTSCTVGYDLGYLDSTILAMTSAGFAVDLVPFVSGDLPGSCSGSGSCPTGSLHANMGTTQPLYGYASFEAMLQAANMVLVNRYHALYPSASQVYWELYNEPDYKPSGGASYQDPALWNAAIISITSAIRGVDTTHWIISDGISSAKAQFLTSLTPTSDTQTVYSFHKYDPADFVDQTSGSPWNPYAVYPRPSSGQPAVGRSGGIAPAYMPFPVPVAGTPANSGVDATAACTARGIGTPIWAANAATVLTAHGQKACVTAGGGSTSFVDMYSGTASSLQVTKADFLTNTSDGIQLALNWAAANGHTGPLSGSVLKIIAGEIGITGETDYLSRLQFVTDLRATLDNAAVVGGQDHVPWDFWSFSGSRFGVRPKGGGPDIQSSNCLGLNGALTGYDLDEWARISTPIGSTTPNCSGGKYATPGY